MPTGHYKHKKGKNSNHWTGGPPKCKVCGKILCRGNVHCRKHAVRRNQYGENNSMWKGDKVKYGGLHTWVAKMLGKPSKCENCGTTKAKRFHWANLTKEYVRDLSKWTRLCPSCHIKHDRYGQKLENIKK